jgi:hypothetical protein
LAAAYDKAVIRIRRGGYFAAVLCLLDSKKAQLIHIWDVAPIPKPAQFVPILSAIATSLGPG